MLCWITHQLRRIIQIITTGPPTHTVGGPVLFWSLAFVVIVCRHRLSSSSVALCGGPARSFTRTGQAMTSCRLQSNYSSMVTLHGGPVVLRPVRGHLVSSSDSMPVTLLTPKMKGISCARLAAVTCGPVMCGWRVVDTDAVTCLGCCCWELVGICGSVALWLNLTAAEANTDVATDNRTEQFLWVL